MKRGTKVQFMSKRFMKKHNLSITGDMLDDIYVILDTLTNRMMYRDCNIVSDLIREERTFHEIVFDYLIHIEREEFKYVTIKEDFNTPFMIELRILIHLPIEVISDMVCIQLDTLITDIEYVYAEIDKALEKWDIEQINRVRRII